jgi:YfiR/HmsC-like
MRHLWSRRRWIAQVKSRTCGHFGRQLVEALVGLALLGPPAVAQTRRPTQYDVEAAYLYQFGNFVQWPAKKPAAEAPKSFPICVLGRDPFGRVLDDTVKGGNMNGLPLAARRVASGQEAAGCRVLFVSSSEDRELAHDLEALHGAPVLTVSDIPDFASRGGMIQFVLIDNRIRFEINVSNAERAGLTVSSQLLKVAVSVRRDGSSKE